MCVEESPMSVPGYQEFMLPLVKLASDGQEHKITDAIDDLADQFGVSEKDREIMLPSGTQTRLYNRVTWALTYLTKSLLLEKSARGRFKIAPRGVDVLKKSPARIDNAFLSQFDEFRAFRQKKTKTASLASSATDDTENDVGASLTPLERVEGAYNELREALADELLSRVRSMKPKAFEQLVVDVLVAMGYGGSQLDAAQVVGKSGDGGIDGVIKEDRLGLDMVYVQAKRHSNDVGPGAIREFVGSLGEHKATKGVFITCSGFTSGATEAAAKAHHRIVLIDGEQLAEYMIDNGVGVANYKSYTVKKLDSDYFGEM
jgi:restriction system protein